MFRTDSHLIDSHKERNLYFKIVGGYLLNPLVPGFERRLGEFLDLVRDACTGTHWGPASQSMTFSPKTAHLSFDNHAYQFCPDTDRGEFSDFALDDAVSRSLIAAQVKHRKNVTFRDDVVHALARLDTLGQGRSGPTVFILVASQRWVAGAKRAHRKRGSVWSKLLAEPRAPALITWESIGKICSDRTVAAYLASKLR